MVGRGRGAGSGFSTRRRPVLNDLSCPDRSQVVIVTICKRSVCWQVKRLLVESLEKSGLVLSTLYYVVGDMRSRCQISTE